MFSRHAWLCPKALASPHYPGLLLGGHGNPELSGTEIAMTQVSVGDIVGEVHVPAQMLLGSASISSQLFDLQHLSPTNMSKETPRDQIYTLPRAKEVVVALLSSLQALETPRG